MSHNQNIKKIKKMFLNNIFNCFYFYEYFKNNYITIKIF